MRPGAGPGVTATTYPEHWEEVKRLEVWEEDGSLEEDLICGDCGAEVDRAVAQPHPEQGWPLCEDCAEGYRAARERRRDEAKSQASRGSRL